MRRQRQHQAAPRRQRLRPPARMARSACAASSGSPCSNLALLTLRPLPNRRPRREEPSPPRKLPLLLLRRAEKMPIALSLPQDGAGEYKAGLEVAEGLTPLAQAAKGNRLVSKSAWSNRELLEWSVFADSMCSPWPHLTEPKVTLHSLTPASWANYLQLPAGVLGTGCRRGGEGDEHSLEL